MPRLWAQPPGAVGTMYMWCGVVVQIDDAKGWLLRCHELDVLHVLMRECAWRVRNLTRVAQLRKEAIPTDGKCKKYTDIMGKNQC